MRGAANPPANDASGESINDKRHIDKALPGRHVGEIGYPEPIRLRYPELAFDMIQGAWRGFVADRRLERLAADSALQIHRSHQPLDRAASNLAAFPPHLPPDLTRAVDLEILREHALDIGPQNRVLLSSV